MTSRRHNPPILYLSTPSPEHSPHTSTIFSDCEADDEDAMSEETEPPQPIPSHPMPPTPIAALTLHPLGAHCSRIPTLKEILANQASPPYTLGAFTAYLHQNHCLENLEFIKDAERYRKKYDDVVSHNPGMPLSPEIKESEELRMLWDKLLHAYIIPNSPREVNIPGDVRDVLSSRPNHTAPPEPDTLDPAIKKVMDLMNESILMNFINEHHHSPSRTSPAAHADHDEEHDRRSRHSGDESRTRSSSLRKHSPHNEASSSKHRLTKSRLTMHASNSSTGSGDQMLTDDSGSLASFSNSPMTPPTTPPSSDLGGSSPKLRHDHTWKKMMGLGRLGNKKKSASRMERMEE